MADSFCQVPHNRHCEEPTGRANARPMTGSATKQSMLSRGKDGLLRFARNDVERNYESFSPLMIGPNSSQLSPLNFII